MDPLLEAILAQNNDYKWDESGLQLEALCYADDNGLLTEDPKDMAPGRLLPTSDGNH
jgi:hypothetical protein